MSTEVSDPIYIIILALSFVAGTVIGALTVDSVWQRIHMEMGIAVVETTANGKRTWSHVDLDNNASHPKVLDRQQGK